MSQKNLYNRFKDTLGEYCAVCQFTELSKEAVCHEHAKELATRDGIVQFADSYNVGLREFDLDKTFHNMSKLYIVYVSLCMEDYLKAVYDILKKYGKDDIHEKQAAESWLQTVSINVFGRSVPEGKNADWKLCEYYRLVRNNTVHNINTDDSTVKEYKNIQKSKLDVSSRTRNITAPHQYTEIDYEDFMLYSKYTLKVAKYIFDNIQLDYKKIVEGAPIEQKLKWKGIIKNPAELERSILRYIQCKYVYNADVAYNAEDWIKIIQEAKKTEKS